MKTILNSASALSLGAISPRGNRTSERADDDGAEAETTGTRAGANRRERVKSRNQIRPGTTRHLAGGGEDT